MTNRAIRRSLLLALGAGLISSCASINTQRQQELLHSAHAACQSAGFEPGKEGYGNCVMTLYQSAENNRQANKATMTALGLSLLANSQRPPMQPIPPPAVTIIQPAPYYPPTVTYPR